MEFFSLCRRLPQPLRKKKGRGEERTRESEELSQGPGVGRVFKQIFSKDTAKWFWITESWNAYARKQKTWCSFNYWLIILKFMNNTTMKIGFYQKRKKRESERERDLNTDKHGGRQWAEAQVEDSHLPAAERGLNRFPHSPQKDPAAWCTFCLQNRETINCYLNHSVRFCRIHLTNTRY